MAPDGKAHHRIPLAIRATALAGLALTALYVAVYVAMRSIDPPFASGMLRMYGLTIVAGRETAMFDALHNGMAPWWVYGLSVIDDVGSLLLALPFAWYVIRHLRRIAAIRWAFARFEKQALLHRHWVHRWGLGGLALFYYLPGFGAGVPITVVLGILARIPLRRFVPFFVVATLAVNGLWAIVLTNAVRLLPDAPWVDAVPLTVVALVVVAGLVGAWRGRAERHVALLDWPLVPSGSEEERLRDLGISAEDGLVRADLQHLRDHLEGKEGHWGRLLSVAELVLLGLQERDALALATNGVTGLEDVAGLDPQTLARKATRAGVADWKAKGPAWTAQARHLVEAQHAGWRRARRAS